VSIQDKVLGTLDVWWGLESSQDRDPGSRFTCSIASCVEVEVHFDSFTCFRDLEV